MQRLPAELSIVLAFGVALGAPRSASAGTGDVRITWTAPTECPSPADVSASVGHLLGRPPTVPEGRALEVRARAERKQARLWLGSTRRTGGIWC